VREYTDTLVRNGATLVRAVRRTADETLRPLEEQLARRGGPNQGVGANQNVPGHQGAAAAAAE
jgi:hypothetical protein